MKYLPIYSRVLEKHSKYDRTFYCALIKVHFSHCVWIVLKRQSLNLR